MSMTVSEARQLYNLLTDIEHKLEDVEKQARSSTVSLSEVFGLLTDIRIIFRSMGLPDEVNQALNTIFALTTAVRGLHTAVIAFQLATGVGWALAGVGLAATAISGIAVIGSAADRRIRR